MQLQERVERISHPEAGDRCPSKQECNPSPLLLVLLLLPFPPPLSSHPLHLAAVQSILPALIRPHSQRIWVQSLCPTPCQTHRTRRETPRNQIITRSNNKIIITDKPIKSHHCHCRYPLNRSALRSRSCKAVVLPLLLTRSIPTPSIRTLLIPHARPLDRAALTHRAFPLNTWRSIVRRAREKR